MKNTFYLKIRIGANGIEVKVNESFAALDRMHFQYPVGALAIALLAK
ncbi:MAG: hypothetical protein AAGC73_08420 [Verrucomicrobiota bacterium]